MQMRSYAHTMTTVSALALFAVAAPALAQDAPDGETAPEGRESTGGFETIIVTANRRAEDVQDVAIPVTALNAELIEQKFSRDLLDLGSIAPNLIVDPILGNGTAAISIRGIQLNDVEKSFDPPVGVFLDGVYLASTTGALLNVFDAEAVEVLRGPQGTLFGRNTIGGLVHVRRNRPTGELGGKLSVTYGRFDQFDIKGVLNLPEIGDGLIKAKIAGVRLDGGGYFFNVTRNEREGDNDLLMITPQITITPSPDLEINLTYDYIDDETPTRPITSLTEANQLFGGLGGLGAPASDADFHRTTRTADAQPASLKTHSITGNITYEFGDNHQLVAVLNYADTNETAIQEFDAVAPDLFRTSRPQQIDQFSAELRYQGQIGSAQVVAGLYYFDSSYNNNQQTFFFGGEVPGTDYQQNAKSYAAFAQIDWEVVDRLTLTLGGRFLRDEKSACGGTGFGAPDARDYNSPGSISFGDCNATRAASAGFVPNVDGTESWEKFTPKVGVSYDFDNALLYFNYSEGFRSGGFNGRGDNITAFGPYNPETVDNFEAGIKSEWLDNRLIFNASAFYTKYDNKQEDVVFPVLDAMGNPVGTTTVVQNAASVTIQGIEVEMRALPTDGLSVGLSLGLLDANYDEYNDVGTFLDGPNAGQLGPIDRSDFVLRRAPDITVQADLAYEYVLNNGHSLTFATDYQLKSDYFIVANSVNTHTIDNTPVNPGEIDGFGLLNASLAYKAENFKVSVFGRNLTGADYFQHALDVGTTFGRTAASPQPIPTFSLWSFGTINAPTTYGVEFQVEF